MTLTPELIWQSRTWLYVSVQNTIVKRIANFIRKSGQQKLIHLHQMWNYIILSTLHYEILIIFPASANRTDKERLHGYFRRFLYDWLSQQQTTLLGSSKIFKFTLLLQILNYFWVNQDYISSAGHVRSQFTRDAADALLTGTRPLRTISSYVWITWDVLTFEEISILL